LIYGLSGKQGYLRVGIRAFVTYSISQSIPGHPRFKGKGIDPFPMGTDSNISFPPLISQRDDSLLSLSDRNEASKATVREK
jgi:hypothetical protein